MSGAAQKAQPAVGRLDPTERLLRSCRGQTVDRPPVWLMRQAGRYLPEYRKVREGVSFLEMCRDVDRAVEVSLQPIRLVGSEAVILFSDIFTPIPGMGIEVDFRPGPTIAEPIRSREQVEKLRVPDPQESTPFVFEILRVLRKELADSRIPLLGFAGAPFTLAAYFVQGRGSKDFGELKRMMYAAPSILRALQSTLTEMVVGYLNAQIAAGAQVVQLFDTWAGLLGPDEYREWVLPVHREIAAKLDRARAPLILYVRGGAHVLESMFDSGADVISLDWRVDVTAAARLAGRRASLQGNLDPDLMGAPRDVMVAAARRLIDSMQGHPGWIFNLGHGIKPTADPDNVRALVDLIREAKPCPAR